MRPCCFTPKLTAKCCFQIWIKRETKRSKIIYDKTHNDFQILKSFTGNNIDFAIKAYGSNCGEVMHHGIELLTVKNWHLIKSNIDVDLLKYRFSQLDYSMSKDTVRQDSLGQQELIYLYKLKYD